MKFMLAQNVLSSKRLVKGGNLHGVILLFFKNVTKKTDDHRIIRQRNEYNSTIFFLGFNITFS